MRGVPSAYVGGARGINGTASFLVELLLPHERSESHSRNSTRERRRPGDDAYLPTSKEKAEGVGFEPTSRGYNPRTR